ncbi:MAG: FAD-dependent oxidoreductase [Pyrinomonadaceae bacterium]
MGRDHLLVIGGVAAGLAAAMQARRARADLDITVLEKTSDISYGACGLPYVVSGLIASLDQLVIHTPDYFTARHGINVELHSEAMEVRPAKSTVVVRRDDGAESEIGYTSLVIATGAAAVCPPLPGHGLAGVFVLRHLHDGRRLLRFIEERRPRAAVVAGAGYIGLEMAEALATRGLKVTVIESSENVMSTLGGALRDRVVEEMRGRGIDFVFEEKVAGFESDGGGNVSRAVTERGRAVEAQLVSIGVGVRPESGLARAAGIETGASGAIAVDAAQRTNYANVYAAGDCGEVLNIVSGRRVWFPLGQPAVRQGWVAGANAASGVGAEERYAGVVGTNAVKVFDLELGRTGLSLNEAQAAGFDATETESEAWSRAGYYPGGAKILTRIVQDRRGRLLGAQMVGREGVAQRINVFVAALHAGLRAEEVNRFDLAYAPPFAPTIDPILKATKKQ